MNNNNYFEYFGIHGWTENEVKNRYNLIKNDTSNARFHNLHKENGKYIFDLKNKGNLIKEHLSKYKINNQYYKIDNDIDIPTLKFMAYTNDTHEHNITIQNIIDIIYEYDGNNNSIDKLKKYQQNINRGYDNIIAEKILNDYSNDATNILNNNNNLSNNEIRLLNIAKNSKCENIYNNYNNQKKNVNYADNQLILNDFLFDNNNKTLLLGSMKMMDRYLGNKNLIIEPWLRIFTNIGYMMWNRMINKATLSCMLNNNTSLFSSLALLENHPQTLNYQNYFDKINDDPNNYTYLGFFLVRFNDEDNKFNKTKEKYFIFFVLLNESSNYIENKYLLLNFRCNQIKWGTINENKKYLLTEIQQIMCLYNNPNFFTYVLLPENKNQLILNKNIDDICESRYNELNNKIDNNKIKNDLCVESWFHKDTYDFLIDNNILPYTHFIQKDDLYDNNTDIIYDHKSIYFLTSNNNIKNIFNKLKTKNNERYSIENIRNNKINLFYRNLFINNYLKIYDNIDKKYYYLFRANIKYMNDFNYNIKQDRLVIDLLYDRDINNNYNKNEICIDSNKIENYNIIDDDKIRTTKLNIYYHDKTLRKIYDINDILNKNYTSKDTRNNIREYMKDDILLAKQIIDNKKINEIFNNKCKNIWEFINKLYNDESKIVKMFTYSKKLFNIGQIETTYENIKSVFVKDGNIRERLSLITNLYNECNFIWDVIIYYLNNNDNIYLNKDKVLSYINKITNNIGIDNINEILEKYKIFYRDTNEKTLCYLPIEHSEFIKIDRSLYNYSRKQIYLKNIETKREHIYPILTERELEILNKNNNIDNNNIIKWNTGYYSWKINMRSLFYKIANEYNKKMISGYSGSADIIIDFCSLFNIDIKLSTLLCIAYMCHHLDHSIFEILMVAKKKGLNYFVNDNDYNFVKNLLENII